MNRRKLLLGLTVALGISLTWPLTAHAFSIINNPDPRNISLNDVVAVLVKIIQYLMAFAAAIASIFVLVSGYQYILSAGNPEKVEKAKMGLTWAIGGFILAVGAFGIVYLLQVSLLSHHTVAETLKPNTPQHVSTIVESLAQLLFVFAAGIAVFYLVLGGFRYVTSQGNKDSIEKAKLTILYAVIGLVVVFGSVAIFDAVHQAVIGR